MVHVRKKSHRDTGLFGPFPLTEDSITENVIDRADQWMIGAFALGKIVGGEMTEDHGRKKFTIQAAGRSDHDIAAALKDYVGQFDAFKFHTYASTRRAFEKECQLFHQFKLAEKMDHPAPPENTKFKCPDALCPLGD